MSLSESSDSEASDAPQESEQLKRPLDTDLRQQRLPGWEPLLTPMWVVIILLCVGVAFLPTGVIVVYASQTVNEVVARYDNCPSSTCTCETTDKVGGGVGRTCTVAIELEKTLEPPVMMYYRLSNFHQNQRRYVVSRSDTQLRDESGGLDTCTPLQTKESAPDDGLTFYPCGLVANSYFNDTFTLFRDNPIDPSNRVPIAWSSDGISWESDRDTKFVGRTPKAGKETRLAHDGHLLPETVDASGHDNEDFLVWMRTAGLPTFNKLYRRIHSSNSGAFKAGSTVYVTVNENFPVDAFDGEKAIVLTETSWLGGKNDFLGWSYIAVSMVSLLLSIMFWLKTAVSPRRLGDMSYFAWPRVEPDSEVENGTIKHGAVDPAAAEQSMFTTIFSRFES